MAKPKKLTPAQQATLDQVYAAAAASKKPGLGLTPGFKPPAPAPAPPPAPARPEPVTPFWTADDLAAINAFNTEYATKLANFDFEVGNLETDTTYQKGQLDTSAKENTNAAVDDAAARGVFRSSLKDAAVYDIEAQRKVQSTFLDAKLTAARLNAGTQKGILANAKTQFDQAMLQKQGENAAGVNDAANSAWATAQAAWEANRPAAVATAGPAPATKPAYKPVGVQKSAFAQNQSQQTNKANAAVAAAKAKAQSKPKKVGSASPLATSGLGR